MRRLAASELEGSVVEASFPLADRAEPLGGLKPPPP